MKIKHLFTGIIAIIFAFTSCSDSLLDIPRKGVIPKDEFYKTDDDASAAIAIVYRYLWTMTYNTSLGAYPMLKNCLSDDVYTGALQRNGQPLWEAINEFTYGSENTYLLAYFQNLYNLIYRCNLIIDNFAGDNLDTPVKRGAVAQAKVWRAWSYMELITLWGTPPLVDHCLTPDEYWQPNGDPQELWDFVTTNLTEAINSGALARKTSMNDMIATVSVGYAQALLGKAYVYMTYSLSGGALGGSEAIAAPGRASSSQYWSKAVEALDQVINSNMYQLYDGPFVDIYKVATNWSPENMWEFNRMFNTTTALNLTTGFESTMAGLSNADYTAYGTIVPCNRACNFLPPRIQAYEAMVAWQGADNDRTYGSIRTYEQLVEMGVGVKEGVRTTQACDGVFDMKWFRDENLDCRTGHYTDKSYPMMRYAEVLLLASEANLMAGNQGKADEYMNQVRRRVNLPDMSNITLYDLQQEKRCELYQEGVRAYDLVRWGLAAEKMGNQGGDLGHWTAYTAGATYDDNGNLIQLNSFWEGTATVEGTTYTLGVSRRTINETGGYGFKAGKHELLPFPNQEMLLSGDIIGGPLKQNPGW